MYQNITMQKGENGTGLSQSQRLYIFLARHHRPFKVPETNNYYLNTGSAITGYVVGSVA